MDSEALSQLKIASSLSLKSNINHATYLRVFLSFSSFVIDLNLPFTTMMRGLLLYVALCRWAERKSICFHSVCMVNGNHGLRFFHQKFSLPDLHKWNFKCQTLTCTTNIFWLKVKPSHLIKCYQAQNSTNKSIISKCHSKFKLQKFVWLMSTPSPTINFNALILIS